MFPSDRLLPPASVMKKIEDIRPGAVRTIMDRAVEIGNERRTREETAFAGRAASMSSAFDVRKAVYSGLAGVLNGLRSVFGFASMRRESVEFLPPAERTDPDTMINFAFAQTGNDIRMAIGDFFKTHPVEAALAGAEFTKEEWEGLDLLPVPVHPWVGQYQEGLNILQPFKVGINPR